MLANAVTTTRCNMIDVLSCSEFTFDVHDIKIQALAGNICNSNKSLNKEMCFFPFIVRDSARHYTRQWFSDKTHFENDCKESFNQRLN